MAKKSNKQPAKKAAKKQPAKKAAKKKTEQVSVNTVNMSDSTKLFLANNFSRQMFVLNGSTQEDLKKANEVAKSESIEDMNERRAEIISSDERTANHSKILMNDKRFQRHIENTQEHNSNRFGSSKKRKNKK